MLIPPQIKNRPVSHLLAIEVLGLQQLLFGKAGLPLDI
jgi:hypothetical protein